MRTGDTMIDKLSTADWTRISDELNADGHAMIGPVLGSGECQALSEAYDDEERYRSHIHMRRHGFGQGEYKYFSYPLPQAVARLRTALYPHLAEIANRWERQLGTDRSYPRDHSEMLKRCHDDGQTRPTPLILKYGVGDYNCLHQDLYGEHMFPIQVVVLLSGESDFEGGEFVLTEQRPRMQSRAEVVPLKTGCAVAFAVNERPKLGTRGYYRVKQRHGVSRLRAGNRLTLGIIFHDAK
ncbi:MAG: 2OG-Fe(II) oxygenase [Rhizobiales bacterium]|nr:2OG-Fe(II) oxygenase [Hyphomicrobiales bacterium]